MKLRHLLPLAIVGGALVALPLTAIAATKAATNYYAMAPGSQLSVHCSTHLGEVTPGSPYLLACTRSAPPTTTVGTTTTTVPSTSTTGASPTTVVPTTTPAPPIGSTPASLMTHSVFNQVVTSWSVASNSTAIVSSLNTQAKSVYSGNWVVNGDSTNGRPIYEAAAGAANVPLVYGSYCPSWAGKQWLADVGPTIPDVPGATPNSSSDQIIAIYQPSTNTGWELWYASFSNNEWSACNGGEFTLSTTNGVFPNPSGETASGIANLATEVSDADVASGQIAHAIGIQSLLGYCEWVGTNGGLPPADRSDCNGNGPVAEGTYLRFAPGTVCGSACNNAFAAMVFQAGLKYGFVVTDQGGTVAVEADSGVSSSSAFGGQQEYEVIAALPWASLQAINYP